MNDAEYISALNRDLMIANARLADAESDRDLVYRTINEIEKVLTDHGVAITSPLSDAILGILHELETAR